MSSVVLDASALIALMREEPGHDRVDKVVREAAISTVNLSEVGTHFVSHGYDLIEVLNDIRALPLSVAPFDIDDAEAAAALRSTTKQFGLSLGDRACLALAQRLGAKAMTTDRIWAALDLDIEIELIR